MMRKNASSRFVNLMAPGSRVLVFRRGSNDKIEKMHWFFEYLLTCSWILSRLTKYIVMMKKNASSRIVNFIAPGSGVLSLGWGSNDCIGWSIFDRLFFLYWRFIQLYLCVLCSNYFWIFWIEKLIGSNNRGISKIISFAP